MTEDHLNWLADKIADRIAAKLTTNKSFQRMCREYLLFLAAEEQESRSQDLVASFFRLAEAKGFRLQLDEAGNLEVLGEGSMGEWLQAIYVLQKDRIEKRLRDVRDRMAAAEDREAIEAELARQRLAANGANGVRGNEP